MQQEALEKKYECADENALTTQDRSKGKGKGKHGKGTQKQVGHIWGRLGSI